MVKPVNQVHYYDFGGFRLDIINRELLKNGMHVPLTQKSFELLHFLIENRGRGIRKNEILNNIWTESYVEEANLAQHIYMIRKVLKNSNSTENYIETIPKYGYRFNGEVTEQQGEELSSPETSDSSYIKQNKPRHNEIGSEKNIEIPENHPPSDIANAVPERPFRYTKPVVFGSILLAIIATVSFYFYNASGNKINISDIKSVAILPFNQIGDSNDEKLGLGLADTLIS